MYFVTRNAAAPSPHCGYVSETPISDLPTLPATGPLWLTDQIPLSGLPRCKNCRPEPYCPRRQLERYGNLPRSHSWGSECRSACMIYVSSILRKLATRFRTDMTRPNENLASTRSNPRRTAAPRAKANSIKTQTSSITFVIVYTTTDSVYLELVHQNGNFMASVWAALLDPSEGTEQN